jgi:hypothetical protein
MFQNEMYFYADPWVDEQLEPMQRLRASSWSVRPEIEVRSAMNGQSSANSNVQQNTVFATPTIPTNTQVTNDT